MTLPLRAALRELRLSTHLIVVGLLSLALAAGAVVVTATRTLESSTEQRIMNRLELNMNVAWRLLHEGGNDARIAYGRLLVGGVAMNGNNAIVDELQRLVGGVETVFQGDERVATNVMGADGTRANGSHLVDARVRDAVLRDHGRFRGITQIAGMTYYGAYDPIVDRDGRFVGALFVGIKRSEVLTQVIAARNTILAVSGGLLLLIGAAFVVIARRLARQIALRERSLHTANATLDMALHNMANGLCVWDARMTLVLANARFCEIYGLPADRVRPGMTHRAFVAMRHANGHFGDRPFDEVYAERHAAVSRPAPATFLDRLTNGRIVAVVHRPTPDGGWTTTYDDVTERTRAESQVAFMARHDSLTKLPNRVLFHERMDEALARGEGVAVLCLDLDRFKAVNDTLGHPVGDLVLRAVAERLLACVRESDTVARLGGDEFAIIQPGRTDSAELARTAARIIDSISESYAIGPDYISIGVSVGVGVAQPTGHDPDALLKQADIALYRAKAAGRATYRFFEPGMDAEAVARLSLESELQRALVQDEFVVVYQPQVSLHTGAVVGFEALARWAHPTRGQIEPSGFIVAAEATGLIVPLGAWVLRRACADAAAWPSHLRLAVNLSPLQFRDPNLVRKIRLTLLASGLSPARLELEITESARLVDSEDSRAVMRELIDLGVPIALDDFGTGFSSLSYLRRFPVGRLKIDRSFVAEIGAGTASDAIIRSIIALARDLGLTTLAEGVETEAQLAWLRAEGCDEAQGFLFSPPRPLTEIGEMLAPRPPARLWQPLEPRHAAGYQEGGGAAVRKSTSAGPIRSHAA